LLVRLILAGFPSLALRYPIKKLAAGVAVVASFAYLLVSGTAFATIRAFIMIMIMLLAVTLDRPAIALRNVAIAALAILIFVPESLFHVGFQMSFAAVVALVAAYEAWRDARVRRGQNELGARRDGLLRMLALFLAGIVGTTMVAGLAVAPFAAFHFHKTQQYSVLANLIAIPACNILVMPAALASFIAMPFELEAGPLWVMGKGIDIMTWGARLVSGLPGAVGRIPAFPSYAFGLIVVGGLWLCIWRQRLRFLGIAGIAVGITLAPINGRPDALIGRDGRLVAVRAADGRLAAMRGRSGSFELRRWLEHDGDRRSVRQARQRVSNRRGYQCDRSGCTVLIKKVLMAVARHPRALVDDCRRASILVLSFPKPPGCEPRGTVIDYFALKREGTHAIYVNESGGVRVATVADSQGVRPWSPVKVRWQRTRRHPKWRPRGPKQASSVAGSIARLRSFAAAMPLARANEDQWRPEIEGDDPLQWSQ